MNCISLNAEDFDVLVRGAPVTRRSAEGVEINIILSDIGWDRMMFSISTLIRESMDGGHDGTLPGDGPWAQKNPAH